MRVSRSRTISKRIRLLHEYGKLVSKKLAMNVFGASVFLASFLLGAQLCAKRNLFSATLCCSFNNLSDSRWPSKSLRSRQRHANRGLKSWGQKTGKESPIRR